MTEKRSFTREDLRDAANNVIDFFEFEGITSPSSLRPLNGVDFPTGRGYIRIKAVSTGSFASAARLSYRFQGDLFSVLKLRMGSGAYGGSLSFRCESPINGYGIMEKKNEKSGNILHEKVLRLSTGVEVRRALEELLSRLG